jgi:hypothetical protein
MEERVENEKKIRKVVATRDGEEENVEDDFYLRLKLDFND